MEKPERKTITNNIKQLRKLKEGIRVVRENIRIKKENRELKRIIKANKETKRYWDEQYVKEGEKAELYRNKYLKWKAKTKGIREEEYEKEKDKILNVINTE
jgi:hypothetical protein